MITAAALLVLLLDVPAPDPSAWCPVAAPADSRVSCPGWTTRSCRTKGHAGQYVRSRAVLQEFKNRTGFPKGRPGYVLDHVRPLACGGCDVAWNVSWQTTADAKQKDGWELKVCGR